MGPVAAEDRRRQHLDYTGHIDMNEMIPRLAGLAAAVGLPLLASLVAWLGGAWLEITAGVVLGLAVAVGALGLRLIGNDRSTANGSADLD